MRVPCPWGLRRKYGEVGREQGGQSRIFLAVALGKFLTSLLSLSWGSQDAEAREGCEQQTCWDLQSPGRCNRQPRDHWVLVQNCHAYTV